jgi:hypothetical protein
MSIMDKSIDTESRLLFARDGGEGVRKEEWEATINGYGVYFWDNGNSEIG